MTREPSVRPTFWAALDTESRLGGLSVNGLLSLGNDSPETSPSRQSSSTDFVTFLSHVRVEPDGDLADSAATIPFAPWPHLIERATAWQSHTREHPASEVILKARQLGISTLAEAYALYVAMERHGNVLVISKTGDDSKDFGRKALIIYDNLPESMQRPILTRNTEQISFVGGGRILLRAPTEHAGRSTANTLVIVDEAAFQQWAAKNYKAYRPTISAGGQLLIISTANGASGWFHNFYWAARAGKMPYKAVFIGVFARPDRDQEWYAREEAAFQGVPDEFHQENPRTEAEAFVAKTGLVYPQFSAERHFRKRGDHRTPPWEECLYRVAGGDWGGGDPTAMPLLGVYKAQGGLRVHGYGLYYRTTGAPIVDELADFLNPWHKRAPLTAAKGDHDAILLSTLAALGLPWSKADKNRANLGTLAMFLDRDWITFDEDAFEPLSHEFASYRWLQRADPNDKDRYATSTPHDHHGDILDATRYALTYIYRELMTQGEPTDVAVSWRRGR